MVDRPLSPHLFTPYLVFYLLGLSFYPLKTEARYQKPTPILLKQELFPRCSLIQAQVKFWKAIFAEYPSHIHIIHDALDPRAIIDIIDLGFKNQPSSWKGHSDQSVIDAYLNRYRLAQARFTNFGEKAMEYGAIETRLYHVYERLPEGLARLYKGQIPIRSQRGLSDEFEDARMRAKSLLPFMESEFKKRGLPHALTRIAFVESMFNPKAHSHRGARGIWQFMPATAKQFLTINSYIDERTSPYKSSVAAAKLLSHNYSHLGSWPLAITAYNHGLQGMKNAKTQTQTQNLGSIVLDYDAKSFGFASRNFYAEFLAATEVYDELEKKSPTSSRALDEIVMVKFKKNMSLQEMLKNTSLSKNILTAYDQGIQPKTFTHFPHKPLPSDFHLYLPRRLADGLELSLNQKKGIKIAKNKR